MVSGGIINHEHQQQKNSDCVVSGHEDHEMKPLTFNKSCCARKQVKSAGLKQITILLLASFKTIMMLQ